MSYFPLFLKLDDKKILIIGGGIIAYHKLSHLLNFSKNITLISKSFCNKIVEIATKNSLNIVSKKYENSDLNGYDIVIVAVDNFLLQKQIFFNTREKNILCNCVDLQQYCDFIFPSYIKKDDLTIAISTSGSSPAFAKEFKKHLKNIIPKDIDKFLTKMKKYRTSMPKGIKRMEFLKKKAKNYIKKLKS